LELVLDDPVFDELHDLKRLGKFKDWGSSNFIPDE